MGRVAKKFNAASPLPASIKLSLKRLARDRRVLRDQRLCAVLDCAARHLLLAALRRIGSKGVQPRD
jgi:hypothetical protein